MALTRDQQNAVDARGKTLLVSAAAGSGKTYTLTKRVIKSIIEDGQDISRLLIVTFTRAAAGELKAKISKALTEAIAEHPDDEALQSQLIKIGNAHISTIDSFFAEPVRLNFEKLGLPASMRLSDEAELAPLRDKIMGEVIESFFERCEVFSDRNMPHVGYNDAYTALVGVITDARDSSKLIPTLCDIYKKLITSPRGVHQLRDHAKRQEMSALGEFFESSEGKAMLDITKRTLLHSLATLDKVGEELRRDGEPCDRYIPDFDDTHYHVSAIYGALQSKKYGEVCAAFDNFAPKAITRIPKSIQSERCEYYKYVRSELHKEIKELKAKFFCKTEDELSALMSQYAATSSLLADILQEFDRLYSAEKIRRGISEFSDMPRFMLKLLLNDDGTLTDYAHRLASNYDEIYIDEYQDVNEIQDTIFRIIGGSHRFMVGDIKQSIYGFREAEPSIFASYRRDFSAYDENDDTPLSHEYDGRTIFMSENFRCDENVIKFANAVCSDVFGAFSESIGYTEQDNLKFSKALPSDNYQSPKVSVNIVHRFEGEGGTADTEAIEEEAQENPRDNYKDLSDEAIVVANQIANLLRNGKNADGTPVRAKNIAVLVRGHRHAKPLIAALKMLNVRYLESSKGELFDGEDMRLLIDLLSVIDNPRSDIPLCHLLTAQHEGISPVMTLEGVITVRRAAENSKSLFDALISYAESGDDANLAGACRDFVALIEKMRIASSKISADKLIKSLVACEQYSALTRTSAYTYVYDSACKYVKNSWSGLYGFLKYFKGVIQKGEGGAEPDSKDADAVTIMTIHQSKGLEFNVCFLFGFGKALSLSEKSSIIFNRDFGASLKLPPINDGDTVEVGRARYESNPIYNAVEAYNRRRLIEEEARIFYVALTRARERLYVSATMTGYISNLLTKLEECADPQYEITASGSYIRWILLSHLHNADMSDDVIDLNFFYRGEQYLTAPFPKATMAEINANTEGVERERAELICAADIGDAQASVFSTVPSKVAASKVSPNMLDDSIFIPVPTGALFSESDEDASEQSSDNADRVRQRIELMRSAKKDFDGLLEINKKPSAAEIGTATHLFLQYCDYKNAAESGIEAEISRLVSGRFISKRSAKIINRHQLRHFFEGELYSLISSAKKVRREFRFGMFRDAREFTQNQELQELLQDKKIFVQGSIDLIIERADGEIILCDYKTDFVSDDERANRDLLVDSMRKKHGEQIKQYKYATEQIFGISPARTCIYSLPLGELIDM